MRFLVTVTLLTLGTNALNNGVGRTPAMGWNSWNKFGCEINEALIREHADAIVASGLADLGYNHINIDDCWQLTRDKDGYIHEDPKTFPSGIKALSDYEWEIDYFKYDNCNNEGMGSKEGTIERYGALRDAINATGRHINYAICSWGEASIWEFAEPLGNSWRTTGDIVDNWESVQDLINRNYFLSKYAAPGGFNDMDMLEVGNGHMTDTEYRTHFAVWAALKSPLLLGHDVRTMTPETFEIIGNKEIIAINQDPLGKSAFLRALLGKIAIWVGELDGGDRVLLVMNGGDGPVGVDVGFSVLAMDAVDVAASASYVVEARDLWEKKDLGVFSSGKIRLSSIPSHGSKILRLRRRNGEFPAIMHSEILETSVTLVQEFDFVPIAVILLFLAGMVGIAWVRRSRKTGFIHLD
ncbi:UNVERIFIED_CONTAM: hypothetical protein HDU68_011549 [Siphonaria sp. JEL0065]|nr:hypothetical protein HDU68_011549 [Siphonaria sp. JEL0065]